MLLMGLQPEYDRAMTAIHDLNFTQPIVRDFSLPSRNSLNLPTET
jgi:hypothetical protein